MAYRISGAPVDNQMPVAHQVVLDLADFAVCEGRPGEAIGNRADDVHLAIDDRVDDIRRLRSEIFVKLAGHPVGEFRENSVIRGTEFIVEPRNSAPDLVDELVRVPDPIVFVACREVGDDAIDIVIVVPKSTVLRVGPILHLGPRLLLGLLPLLQRDRRRIDDHGMLGLVPLMDTRLNIDEWPVVRICPAREPTEFRVPFVGDHQSGWVQGIAAEPNSREHTDSFQDQAGRVVEQAVDG
ncbi:hypothetical protein [Nocardia caishijiensis]|uniref:hypothetical protein n=1 Tax=Nocardia caishijiensis TaxID=184756 RepID=UPI001428C4F4|nr:hypothetical protein [Nocardia caishijiensis]